MVRVLFATVRLEGMPHADSLLPVPSLTVEAWGDKDRIGCGNRATAGLGVHLRIRLHRRRRDNTQVAEVVRITCARCRAVAVNIKIDFDGVICDSRLGKRCDRDFGGIGQWKSSIDA